MIIYKENDGFHYEDEITGKKYSLATDETLGAKTTNDMVLVIGDNDEGLVCWFYGATLLLEDIPELNETVRYYLSLANKEKEKIETLKKLVKEI